MELDVYKEWLGIPDEQRPLDHYTLLRLVQFEDDLDKIRKNYKKLNAHVKKYASGEYSEQSQDLLNELAKAMLCLTDLDRKREYDESLGREFEDSGEVKRISLLNVLYRQKKLTKEQAKEVQEFAKKRGISMRDAVVQMKIADAEAATQAFAQELRISFVDLDEMIPDDDVLDQLPRNVVKRNSILPLFVDDDTLLVACSDDLPHELEEELRMRFSVPIRRVMATPRSINQGIAKYYAPGMRDEAVSGASTTATASSKKPRKVVSQLSEEERSQRKNMGYLFIMWALIGSILIGVFGLADQSAMIRYMPAFIVTPAVAFWVFKIYLK